MPKTRVATQFGMGTSIRSQNYTEAAARAIRDAIWHNSLSVADAFGFPREAMLIDVEIGVPRPEAVDTAALHAVFPYGQPSFTVVQGGLDIPRPDGTGFTVMAHATVIVSFDMEPVDTQASDTERRIILEMGAGNDLYGGDYTKAACRAVHDALHHSSMVLFRSLNIDHQTMRVKVTIGVQKPELVDTERVAAELPRGRAQVYAVLGGQDIHDPVQGTTHVIASAAIEAYVPITSRAWRLTPSA